MMIRNILAWWHCCKGATAIEYGLIAAGISLVIAASIFAFGDELNTLFFDQLNGALDGEA